MTAPITPEEEEEFGKQLTEELGLGVVNEDDGTKSMALDLSSYTVLRAYRDAIAEGEVSAGRRRAFKIFRQFVAEPPYDGPGPLILKGAAAASVIRPALEALDREGRALFGRRMPAYHWIWMIRRLPPMFLGQRRLGAVTKIAMGGLALCDNSQIAPFRPDGFVDVTPRYARSLAHLSGYASILVALETAYRVVGKGGQLEIYDRRHDVHNAAEADLRKRLDEYDERNAQSPDWGGLGIHLKEVSALRAFQDKPTPEKPLANIHARSVPTWRGKEQQNRYLARYGEHFVSLDEAFRLLGHPQGPSAKDIHPELAALTALLYAYTDLSMNGFERQTVECVGYSLHVASIDDFEETQFADALRRGMDWLKQRLPNAIPDSSPSALMERLRTLPVVGTSQTGPIVFRGSPSVIGVDWVCATQRFLRALSYPKVQGQVANVRARAFEDTVRAAVADTPCRPEKWLDELVSKDLRLNGSVLGEIDAAASIPGSTWHILISCKSYPFSAEYERGEYNAVRNVSTKLGEDFMDWARFVVALRKNRIGDNYRIPENAVLVPVLVTPRLLWSDHPAYAVKWGDEEWSPRAISGVTELIAYLNGYQVDEEALDPSAPD